MSDDVAAFLRARLDEDERYARAVEPLGQVIDMRGNRLDETFVIYRSVRVLREVDAKRQIIAGAVETQDDGGGYGSGYADALEFAVLSLAAVYADHPDYRDEWRL